MNDSKAGSGGRAPAAGPCSAAWVFDPWFTAWAAADAWVAMRAPALAWQRRQRMRLQALLETAGARSAWWRARLRHARLDAPDATALLRSLPRLDKAELMAHFDAAVTDPRVRRAEAQAFARRAGGTARAYLGRYLVWESSGSSGEPAAFVHDAHSLAVVDALQAVRGPAGQLVPRGAPTAAALLGLAPVLGGVRTAFVGAIDGPFAGILSLQRQRQLNAWVAATTRAFSFLQPAGALARELQAWHPQVLASYPSMAWVLAEQQRGEGLGLELQAVWTGGETLSAPMRQAISRAFGCPVRDSYGASECLEIAAECVHGAMHLNADWVMLEAVDAHGRAVPAGETAHTTLLTHLANHVQPIIRYDLGDRVRFVPRAGPCACGSTLPVIEVQGRADDVLTLAAAAGRAVHLAPLALTTVLEEQAGVFDFRVEQRGRRLLRLELYGEPGRQPQACARAAEVLRRFLHRQGVPAPQVEVHGCAAPAGRGRSGKLPRVCRGADGPAGTQRPGDDGP